MVVGLWFIACVVALLVLRCLRHARPPRLVRRNAVRVLSDAIGHEATRVVIARADAAYPGIVGRLPPTRAGARNLLEVSAYAIALRDPIVDCGLEVGHANSVVADVVTASIMPARTLLFRLTRLRHRDLVERARWGATLSRRLYYTDPDWVMEDVQVDDGFGFDVTRCVVAEFFASCEMSDLCQRAICDQDLRSATRHSVLLLRSETL